MNLPEGLIQNKDLTYLYLELTSRFSNMNVTNRSTTRIQVLLEKLTVTQLVKKFSAFYGTRRFITVFTRARHWSLS